MPSAKSALGVLGGLVAVSYCGYLLYYFLDTSGSVEDAESIGLGPTLLGLGIVGMLFAMWLVRKIVRVFLGPGSPGRGDPGSPSDNGDDKFDADAVLARYLSRRSTEPAAGSPPTDLIDDTSPPAKRPSFGRKNR